MKKILGILILLGLAGFGYYAISPLFNDVVVNDPLPETPEGTSVRVVVDEEKQAMESEGGFENLSEEDKQAMTKQMEELEKEGPIVANDSLEDLSIELATGGTPEIVEPESESASEPKISEVMDTVGHPASGTVRVIDTEEGQIIRYEDFKTINGPRLHVYLAKDLKANDFIDLGPIRGTEGNINYAVPDDVDLDEYKYVMYWCVPFNVLFNFADVSGF